MHASILIVCSLISCKLAVADKPICCVPTEWEGHAFLDIGEEFQITNAFGSYINGSAHFAYSTNLKKIYQRFKGVQVIDAFPKLSKVLHVIYLDDFSEGIEYVVDLVNGSCIKNEIEKNMTRTCIPADAGLLSSGRLADAGVNMSFSTYRIKFDEKPPERDQSIVTVNIRKEGTESVCYPVHRTTYGSYFLDKGDYTFDLESEEIFDIGPIHSTDIFKVPKQCMGTHVKETTTSKMTTRFLI